MANLYHTASLFLKPSYTEDGKLFSMKPTDGTGDLDFTRGSDKEASYRGLDGLLKFSTINLLENGGWLGAGLNTAPPNWTNVVLGTPTVDTGASAGEIRFTAPTSGDRAFLLSTSAAVTGVQTISVRCVALHSGTVQVQHILGTTGGSFSLIHYLKDGMPVLGTEPVVSGSVYSLSYNVTSAPQYRIGIGTSSGVAGDVTLSQPQLNYGLVADDYVYKHYEQNPQENQLTAPNDFDDAAWTKNGSAFTSGQADKDGGTDAWLFDAVSGTSDQRSEQTFTGTGIHTFRLFAKAGTLNWLRLRVTADASQNAYFDLANGVVGTIGGNVVGATIEPAGNGFYQCAISVRDGDISNVRIYMATGDGNTTQSSGNIYIQDARLAPGNEILGYVQGLTADRPRVNLPIGATCVKGMFEPERTNLFSDNIYLQGDGQFKVLGSSVTFADYTETSPRGKAEMLRILEVATTGTHNWYYDSLTGLTNGETYTFSFFAKSIGGRNIRLDEGGLGFNVEGIIDLSNGSILSDVHGNISVEDWGNGIYRIIATGVTNGTSQRVIFNAADGTNLSYAGDVTKGVAITLIQYELGTYASSPIPTYGAAATRLKDTNILEGFQNAPKGFPFTIGIEPILSEDSNEQYLFSFLNPARSDTYFSCSYTKSSKTISMQYRTNAGTVAWSTSISSLTETPKIAAVFESNNAKLFVDGVKEFDKDLSFAAFDSAIDSFIIGALRTASDLGRRNSVGFFAVYNTSLSDGECVDLTTV